MNDVTPISGTRPTMSKRRAFLLTLAVLAGAVIFGDQIAAVRLHVLGF